MLLDWRESCNKLAASLALSTGENAGERRPSLVYVRVCVSKDEEEGRADCSRRHSNGSNRPRFLARGELGKRGGGVDLSNTFARWRKLSGAGVDFTAERGRERR